MIPEDGSVEQYFFRELRCVYTKNPLSVLREGYGMKLRA